MPVKHVLVERVVVEVVYISVWGKPSIGILDVVVEECGLEEDAKLLMLALTDACFLAGGARWNLEPDPPV